MTLAGGRATGSDLDYDAIEAAVLETEKGRWFLAEHARRNRVANTENLLEALRKIELSIVPGGLGSMIEDARADVAAIRNDMLDDGGAIARDAQLFQNVAKEAKDIAAEIMARYAALNETAARLREAGADTIDLETEIGTLQVVAWRADVSSQRVTRTLGLLDQIAPEAPQPAVPAKLTPKHLDYFKQDEEVFATPEEPLTIRHVPPPPPPDRPRIVIVRRAPGEDLPIPAGNDSAA